MKTVIGLGQLRSNTCGYFNRVVAGETLGVVRRGKLVAWIRPRAVEGPTGLPGRGEAQHPEASVSLQLNAFRCQASRCFDRVAAGQSIDVFYQGKAIAHIAAPVTTGGYASPE
jgi:antitoxin (DNA-binding transcriptional repressor) of toxin-antitoxin stability system